MDRAFHFEIIHRIRQLRMDKQEYVLLKGIMACECGKEAERDFGRQGINSVHDGFSHLSRMMMQCQVRTIIYTMR